MAFSSLFFVLVFLPVFLICYRGFRSMEARNRVLLIFSVIFYAFSGLGALLLLLMMTLVGWFCALMIDGRQRAGQVPSARRWLIGSCAAFIIILGIFKYTGFVVGTLNLIPGISFPVPQIALPLGISFYVFKLISYVADVYHGRCRAESRYGRLLSYTICFHHVTQGPIVRYAQISAQMDDRVVSNVGMARGIYRFCIGLGKKVILADYCGSMSDVLMPLSDELSSMPVLSLWLGLLFYVLQIYLDFSAYCDMALGLGRMCGFRYPENFDYPYIAVSVRDFWRRWHITLSQFFRDYVYIPLGGSRVSTGRLACNLLAVWLLTGLWHGSSWNFVLWGLYYYAFVLLEQVARKKNWPSMPRWLGHIYTIVVFYFGWLLFHISDFHLLGIAFTGMFGGNGTALADSSLRLSFQNNVFFLAYCILACTPFFRNVERFFHDWIERRHLSMTILYAGKTVVALLIFIWSVLGMAGNTYTPFLYNQF